MKLRNFMVALGLLLSVNLLFNPMPVLAQPRSVMVQLFEWPWSDVARECEVYLGPNGFAAVQISPPQEHLSNGQSNWWERYQVASYRLESRSGDESDFKDMVDRCHNAGVEIYADVVLNHTIGVPSGVGFAGTKFKMYDQPGLYSYNDFHHCGRNGNDHIVNYQDRYEVQNCELLGLADLKTENPSVQQSLAEYLSHLLSLGVGGFRVDAAKHIPAVDLSKIFSLTRDLSDQSPFIVSEAHIGIDEPISIKEYLSIGTVNFFQYSYDIGYAFNNARLTGFIDNFSRYLESKYSVVFLENHDLQRTDSSALVSLKTNPTAYRLATVFMLTWPYAYPQIFSGFDFADYNQGPPVNSKGFTEPVLDGQDRCQSPWLCEHRLPGVADLVKFRNYTESSFHADQVWKGSAGQIAFSRGTKGFVAINLENQNLTASITTSLPNNCYCDILSKLCSRKLNVRNGLAEVNLPVKTALVVRSDRICK